MKKYWFMSWIEKRVSERPFYEFTTNHWCVTENHPFSVIEKRDRATLLSFREVSEEEYKEAKFKELEMCW